MNDDNFRFWATITVVVLLLIGGIALKMHNVHECEKFGHSGLYCWTSGSN